MGEMKELYEKVAKSPMLQKKLVWIATEAESAGHKKTKERLIDFAKEAGFDVTLREMRAFFEDLSLQKAIELSDAEMDMVAGGKGGSDDFLFMLRYLNL